MCQVEAYSCRFARGQGIFDVGLGAVEFEKLRVNVKDWANLWARGVISGTRFCVLAWCDPTLNIKHSLVVHDVMRDLDSINQSLLVSSNDLIDIS